MLSSYNRMVRHFRDHVKLYLWPQSGLFCLLTSLSRVVAILAFPGCSSILWRKAILDISPNDMPAFICFPQSCKGVKVFVGLAMNTQHEAKRKETETPSKSVR